MWFLLGFVAASVLWIIRIHYIEAGFTSTLIGIRQGYGMIDRAGRVGWLRFPEPSVRDAFRAADG